MTVTVLATMAGQIAKACFPDDPNLILTEPALLSKLNPLVGWMDRWRGCSQYHDGILDDHCLERVIIVLRLGSSFSGTTLLSACTQCNFEWLAPRMMNISD